MTGVPPTSEEEIRATLDRLRKKSLRAMSKKSVDVLLMDYHTEYLISPLWRKIKKRVLARDSRRCSFCNGPAQVVHHRSYAREVLEGTADEMLASLCNPCHNYLHFDDSGRKRDLKEVDELLSSKCPPCHFPQPLSDLRLDPLRHLPPEWSRLNQIQRKGWLKKTAEIRHTRRLELRVAKASRAARREISTWNSNTRWIPLQDAVNHLKGQPNIITNSYSTHRTSAARYGFVSIGNTKIPVLKINRVWQIDYKTYATALDAHASRHVHIDKVTSDYAEGILYGEDGEMVETTWGHYKKQDGFRFVYSTHAYLSGKSDGAWYCNTCNRSVGEPTPPPSHERLEPACQHCGVSGPT